MTGSHRRLSNVPRRHEASVNVGDFRIEESNGLYRACIGNTCTPWTASGGPNIQANGTQFRVCLGDLCSNWVDFPGSDAPSIQHDGDRFRVCHGAACSGWVYWPESGTSTGTAAEDLGGHRAVYEAADGLRYASATDTANADAVLGITTGAATTGATARYRYDGELTFPATPFTPQNPVWLGESGQLTQTPPTSALSIIVGIAKTDSILQINIQQPIEVL